MSLYDKVTALLDEEIEERTNQIINEYAINISKKHGISLQLLLKDIPETCTGSMCKGIKGNGQRCAFKSVSDGFCRYHITQKSKMTQRIFSCESIHNHGPEHMFVKGCPGCDATNNGLIDLNTII